MYELSQQVIPNQDHGKAKHSGQGKEERGPNQDEMADHWNNDEVPEYHDRQQRQYRIN